MSVEAAYRMLYLVVLLAFCIMIAIAILSRMLDEAYLLDVALIYAMISFIGVLMLSSTHIPPGPKRPRFSSGEESPKGEEGGKK